MSEPSTPPPAAPSTPADPAATPADDLRARLLQATALLESVAADRGLLRDLSHDEKMRLVNAAADVFCPNLDERRKRSKQRSRQRKHERIQAEEAVLQETGIRVLRARPVFITPNVLPPAALPIDEIDDINDIDEAQPGAGPDRAADERDERQVADPQHCYVCKQKYKEIHHFYDQLCPTCAEFNFGKRTESADLRGRVALLTGGRVKIGYQAGIKLLRAGAHLIVTTRFPRDAAQRYAQEPDFAAWSDRLEVFGLDLRHTPSVEAFCHHLLTTRGRLDYIVNNACQTVRRPPEFYQHMMAVETAALHDLPPEVRKLVGAYEGLRSYALPGQHGHGDGNGDGHRDRAALLGPTAAAAPLAAGLTHPAELSQAPLLPGDLGDAHLFPQGQLDQDLQQIDLRERNSWRLTLHEVSSVELLETQLVNAVAPFVLNARLKALMLATPERDKHIVNVSAMEGQFYRKLKTTRHPHTNMAKAALNMMTRTSAADYHADGIHMNSVDTGWINDEDPAHIAARKQAEQRFHPPLDIVDGAARIVDPILVGANTGKHVWGQFLKDYAPTDW